MFNFNLVTQYLVSFGLLGVYNTNSDLFVI